MAWTTKFLSCPAGTTPPAKHPINIWTAGRLRRSCAGRLTASSSLPSRYDLEPDIAGQRAVRRGHGDIAGGCSRGNGGNQKRVGFNRKVHGIPVQYHGGRSRESLSENTHLLFGFPRAIHECDKGAKIPRHPEYRAGTVSPQVGCAVEAASRGLQQPAHWTGAVRRIEAMQGRQVAFPVDPEYCAIAVVAIQGRRPVKLSVGALHQSGLRVASVGAIRLRAKAVKSSQLAAWSEFENRAIVAGPSLGGGAVEVPIVALYQPRLRFRAVGAVRLGTKSVQRGHLATGSNFEGHAGAVNRTSNVSRAVKIPVRALHQAVIGIGAVRAISLAKSVKRRQYACGCDLVNRAVS